MNAEELKQLEPGDDIFIRAKYKNIWDDGDVEFTHTCTNLDDDVVKTTEYTHPDNVILPPSAPKYDPCRRFKKGDKVKLREEVQGRKMSEFVTGLSLGKIYTVEHDEYNHTVTITGNMGLARYSFVHLELVTPVEELEPCFFFDEDEVRELTVYTIYFGTKRNYELVSRLDKKYYTREQAEAERDRLNAEYRKEPEK